MERLVEKYSFENFPPEKKGPENRKKTLMKKKRTVRKINGSNLEKTRLL